MLIFTTQGYRNIRPLTPLPGCSTHTVAGYRYIEVLHRFLNNPDARFLDRHWQDAKNTASRGMTL